MEWRLWGSEDQLAEYGIWRLVHFNTSGLQLSTTELHHERQSTIDIIFRRANNDNNNNDNRRETKSN